MKYTLRYTHMQIKICGASGCKTIINRSTWSPPRTVDRPWRNSRWIAGERRSVVKAGFAQRDRFDGSDFPDSSRLVRWRNEISIFDVPNPASRGGEREENSTRSRTLDVTVHAFLISYPVRSMLRDHFRVVRVPWSEGSRVSARADYCRFSNCGNPDSPRRLRCCARINMRGRTVTATRWQQILGLNNGSIPIRRGGRQHVETVMNRRIRDSLQSVRFFRDRQARKAIF